MFVLDLYEKNAYERRKGSPNAKNFRITWIERRKNSRKVSVTRNTKERVKYMEILESCRVLAVVGMSRSPEKAAGSVPRFLRQRGYNIIPVNPNAETIDGLQTYPDLLSVDEEIDAIVIFRPTKNVMEVVKEAVERRKKRGDVRVVWMQEGIRDDEAARLAEEHGITVVQDRCMAKEYRRLFERQDGK